MLLLHDITIKYITTSPGRWASCHGSVVDLCCWLLVSSVGAEVVLVAGLLRKLLWLYNSMSGSKVFYKSYCQTSIIVVPFLACSASSWYEHAFKIK